MAAAFHDKLGAIFGSHIAGGLRFLASEYARPRRLSPVYLAEVDGRVVGAVEVMLGREKRAGGLALFRAMRREMGWPGAMRAAFGFSLLVADTRERDCAYVEFLGVLPEFRGRGIGRALLDRVAHQSRLAGKPRLMLEVAATNRAAIRLYSGFGFRRVRTYRSRLTRWLFGVGEWEAWELPL